MANKSELAKRMLKYRNVIIKLKNLGIVKVFSDNIADTSGLSSSQVRKDFSSLSIKGSKKGGYQIQYLVDRFEEILGAKNEQKVIIVGYGNIGKAIINYQNLNNDICKIVAAFDIDKEKTNSGLDTPVYHISELDSFSKKNKINIGIIAVPEEVANEVYEHMYNAGFKGILNFTRIHLKEIEGITIKTINIDLQIENLFYLVSLKEQSKDA
ncbi:MAG: redox-sensing transcriptional repressor Rex [Candidatus Omnitrophica bacterium]|nr:redox-sensing transcriptional repressor Rex [Candidatus Omnitrophota bacterium]